MEQRDSRKRAVFALGLAAAVWLSLLLAPCMTGGLPSVLKQASEALKSPFELRWCDVSLRAAAAGALLYTVTVLALQSAPENKRPGEEHGSARWASASAVNRKYAAKPLSGNILLTQNVRIGLDGRKHRRNLNVLVCGGSGAGKTRGYAKPNIINVSGAGAGTPGTSLVILDPKSEILRATGSFLLKENYRIRVLNLIDMDRSDGYNPFMYLKNDNDIQRMVTNLFKNTTPNDAKSSDPFWDQAGMMLLMALVFYLHYECPKEDQNFSRVLDLIRMGSVDEENSSSQSMLDRLFNNLEKKNPEHIALKYYRNYRSGSGKTLKSIQITLISRLEKFNLSSLRSITCVDEMELDRLGEEKTAIFAVIPDNDSSFNFLVGMLYTQMFQQLYYQADVVHGGKLPVHVHFIMDEFANVALPSSFDKLLATMRSREISVSIIIQNLAQLKTLFPKEWESITGNCDEFLYLGGNEQSTFEYVSKLLGKETITSSTLNTSKGRNASTTKNESRSGRELLMPDEIRMLDNSKAILFIRGERPVIDRKYDLMRHPNVKYTSDGGAKDFIYGEDTRSVATVRFNPGLALEDVETDIIPVRYEIRSAVPGKKQQDLLMDPPVHLEAGDPSEKS